jgi:hypothetical protein
MKITTALMKKAKKAMKARKARIERDDRYDEVFSCYVQFMNGDRVRVDHYGGHGSRSRVGVLEHYVGDGIFIYEGIPLSNDQTFRYYGIPDYATVHMIRHTPEGP